MRTFDRYTDPQIHTVDNAFSNENSSSNNVGAVPTGSLSDGANGGGGQSRSTFGKGNLGNIGIIKFFSTHRCNSICRLLNLPPMNPKASNSGTQVRWLCSCWYRCALLQTCHRRWFRKTRAASRACIDSETALSQVAGIAVPGNSVNAAGLYATGQQGFRDSSRAAHGMHGAQHRQHSYSEMQPPSHQPSAQRKHTHRASFSGWGYNQHNDVDDMASPYQEDCESMYRGGARASHSHSSSRVVGLESSRSLTADEFNLTEDSSMSVASSDIHSVEVMRSTLRMSILSARFAFQTEFQFWAIFLSVTGMGRASPQCSSSFPPGGFDGVNSSYTSSCARGTLIWSCARRASLWFL